MNLFMAVSLEPVPQVEADQICIRRVRPVEVFETLPLRVAMLEVQRKIGYVEDPRSGVQTDTERNAFAIGIGKQRTDDVRRLRVLVIERAEANVPVLRDVVIGAEAIGVRVLPVLRPREAGGGRRHEIHAEIFEATPIRVDDVEFDVPLWNRGCGDAEVREGGEGERAGYGLA